MWSSSNSLTAQAQLNVSQGGTGATDEAGARSRLGLAIGTNVQAYNTNLQAISNGTWTGSNSISTVGNITSGTWNGSIIDVQYGGTGINTSAATGIPIITSGNWSVISSLSTTQGGTGTTTQFTQGSMVFAGASGAYSQDNDNLFWDNTNKRLGIGTNTPAAMLSLYGTNNAMRLSYDAINYATINSASDGTFQINTTSSIYSDSAVTVGGNNPVNTSVIFDNLSRDYYVGVDNSDSVFKIGTGQVIGTNAIFSVNGANNFVGIGNTSPATLAHVGSSSTATGNQITVQDSNGTCTLDPGSGASWVCTSDRNAKYDIAALEGSTDVLMKLTPTIFKMIVDGSAGVGFIAQDVQKIIPEAVRMLPDGNFGLDATRFIPYMVGSIQDQEHKITSLALSLDDQSLNISNLKLQTDQSLSTVSDLKVSIDNQLDIVANTFASIGQSLADQNSFNSAQQKLNVTVQDQINELKAMIDPTNQQLLMAQSELNSADIGYIKALLGVTGTNASGISISGKISAKSLEIAVLDEGDRTIGTASILPVSSGENDGKSVFVANKNITPKTKIFTSFQGNAGSSWIEKEKDQYGNYIGFRILLAQPAEKEVQVDWWIIEEK